jgi:putative Mg2+ transporter-C (MgtC) family protein
MEEWRILGLVAVSMLLGGVIGYDREKARKPAGLRTHMFVSGASALLVSLSHRLVTFFQYDQGPSAVEADPIRIIHALVIGVSFLAAGTIVRDSENQVRGLTTAASLLLAALVGVCVALSLWIVSIGVVLLAIAVLQLLGRIEQIFVHQER